MRGAGSDTGEDQEARGSEGEGERKRDTHKQRE